MKLNINDYPNIFFTSDWHLGHNKEFLYGPRGCKSRNEHVEWLITKINEQTKPNDLIIHLGDMCLTSTMEEYVSWLNMIKCKNIWSISGNHDNRFFELIKQYSDRYTEEMIDGMVSIKDNKNLEYLGQYAEFTIIESSKICGQKAHKQLVTLCHYAGLTWNHMHHGAFMLHGHSHGNLSQSDPFYEYGKRLDCGIENALKWSEDSRILFSWEDIKLIMAHKRIELLDHHDRTTT